MPRCLCVCGGAQFLLGWSAEEVTGSRARAGREPAHTSPRSIGCLSRWAGGYFTLSVSEATLLL
jgi:hypothetical protein